MKIERLASGLDVAPIYWALQENPQLWNQNCERTEKPDSPHRGVDDIWIRFGDPERVKDGQPQNAHWYPAADVLGVKKACLDVMRGVDGTELGGVLITRIPAGSKVLPHVDGGWHACRYQKYALQITSAPGQRFMFEDDSLETRPGDLYWFDNAHTHWVTNPTNYKRITMIICVRKEI